jgi:hypothetical protein
MTKGVQIQRRPRRSVGLRLPSRGREFECPWPPLPLPSCDRSFLQKECSTTRYAHWDFPAFKLGNLPDGPRNRGILYLHHDNGVRGSSDFSPGTGSQGNALVVRKNGFINSRDYKRGRTWEWRCSRRACGCTLSLHVGCLRKQRRETATYGHAKLLG